MNPWSGSPPRRKKLKKSLNKENEKRSEDKPSIVTCMQRRKGRSGGLGGAEEGNSGITCTVVPRRDDLSRGDCRYQKGEVGGRGGGKKSDKRVPWETSTSRVRRSSVEKKFLK